MILINPEIKIDKMKLPQMLQEIIKQLEEYEKENKWIMYEGTFEGLDTLAKSFLLKGKITEEQYETLLKKYGGYLWQYMI